MKYLFFIFIPFFSFAQQVDVVDFKQITATVTPNVAEESIQGTVRVQFQIKKNTETVYLDAKSMTITKSALEGVPVEATTEKFIFKGPFEAGKEYTAFFDYQATPKQTLYFTGDQVWTQGQGKYTSHWLPSLDDMNDKIEFDITYSAPKEFVVIANGAVSSHDDTPSGLEIWNYDMKKPMSSYLVAFAMGDFQKKTITSNNGVPIALYYRPKDSAKVEPTYRYTKEIFDFFETEIGVPYPWQNYKQVPVRDFLYAGMENTTCTLFSEAFVVDSTGFNDRNYVNVNAHELAHQWFGNLVTETSGTHHWLQEGFATYYALLAEREVFGDDYFYWKLYNSAEQLKALSEEGKGQSLLDPKASSLIFYEKGAWALHILKELIGEDAFNVAIKKYLEKYQFKNVATQDFVAEVKLATAIDITSWERDWLQQSAFQATQAYESLVESSFMNEYFKVSALREVPIAEKSLQLKTALTFPNDFIGQEAIYQLRQAPFSETIALYKRGFESNNLFVRQAIALTMTEIPVPLEADYETLLKDESYVTQEAALYGLWSNFPQQRKKYLDTMEGVTGFQDKNVRQLWLVLAILTDDYQPEKRKTHTDELWSYTSPQYSFEIRQKAFEYINEIGLYSPTVVRNLVNASVHHNWRFRNIARELLDGLLKEPQMKTLIVQQLENFSTKEKAYLISKGIE